MCAAYSLYQKIQYQKLIKSFSNSYGTTRIRNQQPEKPSSYLERGGLGILVPSIESQTLTIKYLLELGKENNNNIWTYLGRCWAASKIHNFTPEWNFIKAYIKEMKNKSTTTKNICNTIVNNVTKNYLLANEAIWNLINKQGLDWKQIWLNTFSAYNIPYENNLYYKILHRVIYVNHKT